MESGKCPHCGSTELALGTHVGQSAEAGSVGLSYKTKFIFGGTEPLLADLCLACGSVVRFYVKEPRKNWVR